MLGDNIRAIRKAKKISINKVAEMTEISLGYLSDLENNKFTNPTLDKLEKIADTLGVSIEAFFKAEPISEEQLKNWSVEYNLEKLKEEAKYLENPDIRAIARAGEAMSPSEAKELRQFAERLYPNAFNKDSKK